MIFHDSLLATLKSQSTTNLLPFSVLSKDTFSFELLMVAALDVTGTYADRVPWSAARFSDNIDPATTFLSSALTPPLQGHAAAGAPPVMEIPAASTLPSWMDRLLQCFHGKTTQLLLTATGSQLTVP